MTHSHSLAVTHTNVHLELGHANFQHPSQHTPSKHTPESPHAVKSLFPGSHDDDAAICRIVSSTTTSELQSRHPGIRAINAECSAHADAIARARRRVHLMCLPLGANYIGEPYQVNAVRRILSVV